MPKSIDRYRRVRRALKKAYQHANKHRMKGQARAEFLASVRRKTSHQIMTSDDAS